MGGLQDVVFVADRLTLGLLAGVGDAGECVAVGVAVSTRLGVGGVGVPVRFAVGVVL